VNTKRFVDVGGLLARQDWFYRLDDRAKAPAHEAIARKLAHSVRARH
jgi:hypothetical protein